MSRTLFFSSDIGRDYFIVGVCNDFFYHRQICYFLSIVC